MNKNKIFTLLGFLFSLLFTCIFVEVSLVGLYLIAPKIKNKFLRDSVSRYYFNTGRRLDQYFCGKYDPELFYRYKEGSCHIKNLEFESKFNVNSFGTRDLESKLSIKQGIAFLGDSHTSGWGVLDKERFSNITSKETKKNGINLGISSYGTARELSLLKKFEAINPGVKYVVIQYESNDIEENRSFVKNNELVVSNKEIWEKAKSWNIEKTTYHFGDGWRFAIRHIKSTLNKDDNSKIHLEWSPDRRALHEEKGKDEFHVEYFFKTLYENKDILENRKVIIFGISVNKTWFGLMQKKLTEYQGLNITLMDANAILDSGDYFYIDRHINANGHKKIAESLIEIINRDQTIK